MDGLLDIATVAKITKPDRVRIAGEGDRQRLWDNLMLAAHENAMAPVYDECVEPVVDNLIAHKSGVAGVIDGTTAFAGSVGLTFAQFWYSKEWHIEEMWCFVHPDYRRGSQNRGHIKALLDFSKWWANEMGMPLLMGVLSEKRTEGKVRLYQRSMPMKGALFLHRPKMVA
jgi:hypothetical protein